LERSLRDRTPTKPISHRTITYTRESTIPRCSRPGLQLGSETAGHSPQPNIRAAQVGDLAVPSHSRLPLHDHERDALTVASLASLDLDHAHLAYLSACSTALSRNERLRDEAIHVASGFQLAGFSHVIGTQWAINDSIAADFHTHLTSPDATLHFERTAHALHQTRAVPKP
jgi:CHAT domain-containing protein